MVWIFISVCVVMLVVVTCVALFLDASCFSTGDHYHDHDHEWLEEQQRKLNRKPNRTGGPQ